MKLDKATVAKIAKLGRIKIADADQDGYVQDLTKILDFFKQLDAADTADVEPMTGVGVVNLHLREDGIKDGNYKDDLLKNAPDAEHGFFAVPKVVE